MLKYFYKFGQFIVYATLFLPLFVNDRFVFPFITPRNFAFRILMVFGAVVLGVLWMNYKELRPKKNWLNIAVISLIVAKLLSAIFGINFYNAFWSSYERMEGVVAWLFFGIFYYLIITVFRKREEWLWLFRIAMIPAIMVAIYGFGQALGWDLKYGREQARIEGTLGNAAYMGAYMAIHFGLALYIILRDKILALRWVAVVLGLVFFIALALTGTRGAAVGLIIGFVLAAVFFIIFAKNNYKKIRITMAGALAAVIIFGGLVMLNKDAKFVQEVHILQRLSTISLNDGTTKSRLYIWNMAWEGFKNKPIFGWGQDNFYYIYNKYYDTQAGEEWVDRAHNNLLDQLSMTGIVGFLAYLAVIGFPFYIFYRLRKKDIILAALLFGVWTAYVVQNQFVFDSLNTYIGFFILLGLAEFKKYDSEENNEDNNIDWNKSYYNHSYNIWIAIGMLIALLIVNGVLNYPGFKANRLTINALERSQYIPQESFDYFQQALDINSFGNKEIVMQLQIALGSYLSNDKLSNDFKTKVVNYSVKKIEDALEREPDDARLLIFSSYIYHIARALDNNYLNKAHEVLLHAAEMSPQRAEIYEQLSTNASLRQDNADMLKYAKMAYDIDPEVLQTMTRYLDALLATGNNTEALLLADKIMTLHEDRLDHRQMYFVAKAYAVNSYWDRVVLLGEQIVKLDNKVYQYWDLLAQGYEQTGQDTKAAQIRAELDKVKTN